MNTFENIVAAIPVAYLIQNMFELQHAGYFTLSQSLLLTTLCDDTGKYYVNFDG